MKVNFLKKRTVKFVSFNKDDESMIPFINLSKKEIIRINLGFYCEDRAISSNLLSYSDKNANGPQTSFVNANRMYCT